MEKNKSNENFDNWENELDKAAIEQDAVRAESRRSFLLLKSGCLTRWEGSLLFGWLGMHSVADPSGSMRLQMLKIMSMKDIDNAIKNAKYVPARLKWEIEKKRERIKDEYGDWGIIVNNERDEEDDEDEEDNDETGE